ncbi:MAG TPA: TonB-dependent receptor [Bryobacteraceae bacterium]|nr:TonB-dependent receptor [Bryobacteraceae bacterium]
MSRFHSLALCLALLLTLFSLNAQVTSTVTGTVTDPSGAAVPSAAVSLRLAGAGADAFSTKTGTSGTFTIPSVSPNTYDLIVEASGFLKVVVNGLEVLPGRTVDVPAVKLAIGTTSQSVEVTESANTVQTTSSDVSTTITKTQIQDLPTMNRSPLGFLQTQAGINDARGNTTVNGQRSSFVNVTLDGVNIQDNFIRQNDMDFLPNLLLLDQVAEVTVSSSNADASTNGGSSQVTFVTPSGTNQFHGKGYWSNRNSDFAANSFFNNQAGVANPFLNQNQIGGTLGGHIIKDKLFFYVNYEAYRQKQQTSENYTVLTPGARSGNFTYLVNGQPTTTNLLTLMGVQANSVMQALLAQVPTTINNFNKGDSSASLLRNTAGYQFNVRDDRTRDNLTGTFDYNLSTKNTLHLSLVYNRDILDRPDEDATFHTVPSVINDDVTHLASLSWRTNPTATITNQARVGFNLAPALFVAQPTGLPFFATGESYTNPNNTFLSQGRYTNTYNWSDSANWLHGAHTVSFGFQGEKVTIRAYNYASIIPSYALGFGTGNQGLVSSQLPGISASDLSSANTLLATLAGYLNTDSQLFNVTSRTSGYINGAPNLRNYFFSNYAGYVTDTWRASRRVTATLGLRWDHYTPVDEKDALALLPVIENGNPIATLLDPNMTLNFAGSAVGRPWYSPSMHEFAPNVGLAWDVFGDGKTAVRGGFGIFYVDDNLGQSLSNSVGTAAGLSTTVSNTGLSGFISNNPPGLTAPPFVVPRTLAMNYALNPSGNAVAMPDPGLTSPYVSQWNIGIEHSVKNTLLNIRYVGNHGVKEIRGLDYNQVVISGLLPAFQIAQQNGLLAQKQGLAFSPVYNANVPGSQQTPYFNAMPSSGYLTNSSVISYIQTGQVGELANFYQTNRVNGPYNYYNNPNTLGANMLENFSTSSYNALVLEATRRMTNGFGFQANYVFSKVLSDSQNNQQTDFEPLLDMNNAKIEKARVPGMTNTHVFKANFNYDLPFGGHHRLSGNALVNKVIGNWNMAGIFTLQSGSAFSILDGARGTLNRAARSTYNTVDTSLTLPQLQNLFQVRMTGNGPYYVGASAIGSDGRAVAPDGTAPFTGQAFYEPPAGTLGQLQRGILDGPSVWDLDFKISKDFKINERQSVQLRMDSTNFLNHTTWYVGDQTTTSTTFGKITSQYYGNRLIQFALYYKF